jgi:hypothetical protein
VFVYLFEDTKRLALLVAGSIFMAGEVELEKSPCPADLRTPPLVKGELRKSAKRDMLFRKQRSYPFHH